MRRLRVRGRFCGSLVSRTSGDRERRNEQRMKSSTGAIRIESFVTPDEGCSV